MLPFSRLLETCFDAAAKIYLASVMSIVASTLIYLTIRGKVLFDGGFKYQPKTHVRWSSDMIQDEYHSFVGSAAKGLVLFPIGTYTYCEFTGFFMTYLQFDSLYCHALPLWVDSNFGPGRDRTAFCFPYLQQCMHVSTR